MDSTDAHELLRWLAQYDARVMPADPRSQAIKAMAWSQSINAAIPLDWARRAATGHYAESKDELWPSWFNREWTEEQRRRASAERPEAHGPADAHCGKLGCACTHTGGCYRGWIDTPDVSATQPCQTCRFELHKVVKGLPPGRARRPGLLHSLRSGAREREQG